MIPWKQRLYAFLIRRVLGPFLDAAAIQKLHDSIDFSLQEGKYVLKDVSLNSIYLSTLLASKGSPFSIKRAIIRRLEIHLSLQENSGNKATTRNGQGDAGATPQSSLAWRAMQLGSTSASAFPAVSLVAEIVLDGLELELVPMTPEELQAVPPVLEEETKTDEGGEPSAKSIVGSYMDAAFSSLKLALRLSNLNVKICGATNAEGAQQPWIRLGISSIAYKDLDLDAVNPQSTLKTIANKSLDISEISLQTGSESIDNPGQVNASTVSTIAMAQGNGKVYYRMMERTNPMHKPDPEKNNQIQQDIEVSLNHRLNISLDVQSISRIKKVLDSISKPEADQANTKVAPRLKDAQMLKKASLAVESDDDREDLKTITGIMKQYREAYHLAENNQFRGGILVPSHAYVDDEAALEEDEAMTFDVFFDANDQSFYNAASVLRESMIAPADPDDASEGMKIHLKFCLLSANIKVNFLGVPDNRSWTPAEYALLTMDDLNISYSSSNTRSEVSCTIAHFEVEDAQLEDPSSTNSYTTNDTNQARVDIGSLLCFKDSNSDEYHDDAIVSQVPCISVNFQKTNSVETKRTTCDINLLPIEITVRQRTLKNFASFAASVGDDDSTTKSSQTTDATLKEHEVSETSITCACSSITIRLPINADIQTDALFSRCGETLEKRNDDQNLSLGVVLDTVSLEYHIPASTAGDSVDASAKLSCLRVLTFVSSGKSDKLSVSTKTQRFDIALFNGRTEVAPYIPLSLEFKKCQPSNDGKNHGRTNFPIVPTISSFKARQEDEDEELKIDHMLFSKLHDVDADSRKDLRGKDPQFAMVSDAEKSSIVASIYIPEIIVDLTKSELATIASILDIAAGEQSPKTTASGKQPADSSVGVAEKYTSVALSLDQMTISIKDDFRIEDLYGNGNGKDRFSCVFAMNDFKTHTLLDGSKMKNPRVLVHDFCLYSALHQRIDAEVKREERTITQRVTQMKQRIKTYLHATVTPILYRSQIFTPICQEAPSFLVDIRDLTSGSRGGLIQKQVHMTLYHLSFRYDVDSRWVEGLKNLLPSSNKKVQSAGKIEATQTKGSQPPSMQRVFISVADCNLDYTSPSYFDMSSRSIVRLGDFRFSSNIMTPPAAVQAYSLSLGDFSYYINNERLSYASEDRHICRASILREATKPRARSGRYQIHGTTAEALLREMGFVEVLGLDSMDAVIAVMGNESLRRDVTKEAGTTTSLTFGVLSVTACKDSFNCFSTTVGEVQMKLTAMGQEEMMSLQEESDAILQKREAHVKTVEKRNKMSGRTDNPAPSNKESDDALLLDGYDWTEIDHDPLPKLEIPDDEDQVAGWYNSTNTSVANTPASGHGLAQVGGTIAAVGMKITEFPGRIVHHHFPIHSITDPLADGDMGASKYAGDDSLLNLKSRILVHRLMVKLRFYDGYDWPDRLSQKTKKGLNKNGRFVIETLPTPADNPTDADGEMDEFKQRGKLMSDLLHNNKVDNDPFGSPFDDVPLPEDRASKLQNDAELRRLSRKTKTYLQISANGVKIRMDSFATSWTHRLASIMSLSVSEMFFAETASLGYPVKMLGEWVNDSEHPRDTRCGTLMLKMVTYKPKKLVTADNEVESDDCDAQLQLLPMRLILDQRAIHFSQYFFRGDPKDDNVPDKKDWSAGLHQIPPPRFRAFGVKPWKLKVDYAPQKMDVTALRDGSVVELINIVPIDGMVITLKQVVVEDVVGFGDVMGGLTSSWLNEVVSTQLHKFVANARPFEPLTDVGQGISDLVVLPYEAFKNGDAVQSAMTSGVKSLAQTLTFQTLTTTSRLTEYAANRMATFVGGRYPGSASNPLPARPTSAPKGVQDVTGHAMQSLARGFQAANYKVVVVPYREYGKHGATGAATSVLRGIPVMVIAPMTGAAEALSYTLLGARNALRPDLRREEEAARTGFTG